jgi:hypothetical protein
VCVCVCVLYQINVCVCVCVCVYAHQEYHVECVVAGDFPGSAIVMFGAGQSVVLCAKWHFILLVWMLA